MVFVFGTVCLDRIRRVPTLPPPGGYVEITEEQVQLGGEAANTANALVRWGAQVRLAGNRLGSGAEGRRLHAMLQQHELPTDLLCISHEAGEATPVCDIYVTPDGERTMFGKGFSHMDLGLGFDDLPVERGQWFTIEPNLGVPARDAARFAHAKEARLYLMDFLRQDDPIPSGAFWQSSTDWVGKRGNTQRNVTWVKEFVAERGCFAILSDGPNGFVAGGLDRPVRAYPPFPAPAMVDSTGAGDVFRAGMLLGLDEGWPLERTLQFAAAAGCLACRAFGATADVPSRAEVEAHVRENPDVARQFGA